MEVRTVKCQDVIFISLCCGQHLCNAQIAVPTNWKIAKVHPLQKTIHMLNMGNSHQLQSFKTSLDVGYDIHCHLN